MLGGEVPGGGQGGRPVRSAGSGPEGPEDPAALLALPLLGSDLLRWAQQRDAPGRGPVPRRLPLGLVRWEAVVGDRDGRRGGLLLPSFWAWGVGPRLGPPGRSCSRLVPPPHPPDPSIQGDAPHCLLSPSVTHARLPRSLAPWVGWSDSGEEGWGWRGVGPVTQGLCLREAHRACRGPTARTAAVRTGLEASEGGIGGACGHTVEVRTKGNRAIRRQQTSSVKGCRELF